MEIIIRISPLWSLHVVCCIAFDIVRDERRCGTRNLHTPVALPTALAQLNRDVALPITFPARRAASPPQSSHDDQNNSTTFRLHDFLHANLTITLRFHNSHTPVPILLLRSRGANNRQNAYNVAFRYAKCVPPELHDNMLPNTMN
jgi:hypothetical protein